MAITVNATGRQVTISSDGTAGTFNATIPLNCNFKVIDAWMQDAAANDTFTLTDKSGRQVKVTCYAANYPTAIGKLDWIMGPATVSMTVGTSATLVYLILGNK